MLIPVRLITIKRVQVSYSIRNLYSKKFQYVYIRTLYLHDPMRAYTLVSVRLYFVGNFYILPCVIVTDFRTPYRFQSSHRTKNAN